MTVTIEYDITERGELLNQIDNLSDDLSSAKVECQDLEVRVSRQNLELEELRAWKRRAEAILPEAMAALESRQQECTGLLEKVARYKKQRDALAAKVAAMILKADQP